MSKVRDSSEVVMLPKPQRGTVEKEIAPYQSGRVQAMGSYWPAKLYQPDSQAYLLAGDSVLVVAMQGITLLVVPES